MATSTPTVNGNMGAFDIIGTAFEVAKNDLRIAALQLVSGLLGIVPLLGPLLATVTTGLATQFADETLGNDGPRNSIGIRFVYGLLTGFVVTVLVFIGTLFLILPGIYLALKLSLAIPSVWAGDRGPIEALSDSWERTDGNLLTLLGVVLLFFVIAMVLIVPVMLVSIGGSAAASAAEMGGAGLALASPLLLVTILVVAITIGSISVAAQTVMYRSFGGETSGARGGVESQTQF